MKRTSVALVVSLLLGIGVSTCYASPRATQVQGAFICSKANSVGALVRQISTNPSVAALYARHFGVSQKYVKEYFQNSLRLTKLNSPRIVDEYYVGKNGRTYLTKKKLPVGTQVFVSLDGQLVLDCRCGNPLVRKLPVARPRTLVKGSEQMLKPPVQQVSTQQTAMVPADTTPVVDTVQMAKATVPDMYSPTPEADAVKNTMPNLPHEIVNAESSVDVVMSAVPAAPSATVVAAAGGSSKLPYLLPLLLGGGAKFASKSDHPKPPQAPEPGSFVVLAAGLSAATGMWKLRKRA